MARIISWPVPGLMGAGQALEPTMLEREVKLAVPSLAPVEARLRRLPEACYLGAVQERNLVLDTPREDLKARDERLRIREIGGIAGVQVTWKGPASTVRGVRRREEREFHADDGAACLAVLAHLGLHPLRSYEKARASWRLHEVLVCLDLLPCGSFVEIEFLPSVSVRDEVAVLERIVALLELRRAPRVQASYARLQQEWAARKKRR